MSDYRRFYVTIHFTDGRYGMPVHASSPVEAISMALIDARMASPAPQLHGDFIKATIGLKLEEAPDA